MIVLVSFPKSGRTWLRVMLDKLGVKYQYEHGKIKENKFVFYEKKLKKHSNKMNEMKCIYMIRCPIDTIVSWYFQMVVRKKDDTVSNEINQFCKMNIQKVIDHHLSVLEDKDRFGSFHLISYENLKRNGVEEMKSLLDFCNKVIPHDQIEKVVEECEFNKMKNFHKEQQYAGKNYHFYSKHGPEAQKIRKGKIGGYVDYLEEDTIKQLNKILAKNNYYERLKKHEDRSS